VEYSRLVTDTFHKTVEATLNLLPEVRWDRWSGDSDRCCVFGWVNRDDGKFDFVLITFDLTNEDSNDCAEKICTSSAKYSEDFGKRLGFENHHLCKRVEKDFPNVQSIHLKDKCVWCGKTYEEHRDEPFPNGAVAKTPCGLLKSGFVAKRDSK